MTVSVPIECLDKNITVHEQVITQPMPLVHELQKQVTVLSIKFQKR